MTPILSPNTQAILLLTAPLLVGRGTSSSDLLTPSEYKRFARHLRDIQHKPADLILPDAGSLLRACNSVIDESRLQRLLARGFLLSQVVEQWTSRAIWVISRADIDYSRRLKSRLREDSPAVLYGCGDISLLDAGGLAVVGSRHVDDTLIRYTEEVGCLSAKAGRGIVSGGARGIDQAAMRGALAAGGTAIGVLADSLEKTTMNRENRNFLIDGKLLLISPYDPGAGFNVGHAMQRNKLIYGLADTALVVSSDLNKGGTWAGAVEQLDKLKFTNVHVRSTGELSPGLDALLKKGAVRWPDPQDVAAFESIFDVYAPVAPWLTLTPVSVSDDHSLENPNSTLTHDSGKDTTSKKTGIEPIPECMAAPVKRIIDKKSHDRTDQTGGAPEKNALTPADVVFSAVRSAIYELLQVPMKDAEVATSLNVSNSQAKLWLSRLLDEGVLEKQKKSSRYIVKLEKLL